MNINDVQSQTVKGDRLESIFARQRELMEKYHPIEERNGLLLSEDVPVDLNDRFGQARLKDFAWRITEELAESLEALDVHRDDLKHFFEELSDAFHFLVELCILSGFTPQSLTQRVERLFPLSLPEGTKKRRSNGRVYLDLPSGNTQLRYRWVVEQMGRQLNTEDFIHHHNNIPSDDRLCNLQETDVKDHMNYHNRVQLKRDDLEYLYWERGFNLHQVAATLGCGKSHVADEMKRLDIPRRNTNGRPREVV